MLTVIEEDAKVHGFNYVFARKHEDALKFYEEITGAKLLDDTYCDGSWSDSEDNNVLIIDEDQGVYDAIASVANLMLSLNPEDQQKVGYTLTSIWL
jgi:hypothetical protein